MNEKPTVIQVINDLGRGGAESLLVGFLPELSREFNIVLVTLRDHMEFDESEIRSEYRYSLGYTSMKNLPGAIRRLKKIINKHKPALVVSHLYWSTIIGRLACPARIPMIFTVHQLLSDGAFNFNRKGALLRWIDKLTYRKRHVMIGVSQGVIDDYHKEVGLTGKSHVLHNYVDDIYFQNAIDYTFPSDAKLNMVAVGNPKWEKN